MFLGLLKESFRNPWLDKTIQTQTLKNENGKYKAST